MTYCMIGANGNVVSATDDAETAAELGCVVQTELPLVVGWDNNTYIQGDEPARPVTAEDYDAALEAHLDAEKNARGYTKREPTDYYNSTNARFAQDAADWAAHVTAVMEYGLAVMNAAKANQPVPSIDDFKAGLPCIVWTVQD